MSYPVYCAADFGAANTGLTVHGKLFDASGAQVGSTITSGFVEPVAGLYLYTLSAPDSHAGVFVMYNSANTTLRRAVIVAPRETENSDAKTSAMATPTNVTSAQTAITNAISALNNLSQTQAQSAATAALNAYDPPTKAELDAAQTTITNAVSGLNNLSGSDILALSVEAGHSMLVVLRALYAAVRGKSLTDDPEAPTYFEYLAPDDLTVRLRHDISEDGTVRSVTVG